LRGSLLTDLDKHRFRAPTTNVLAAISSAWPDPDGEIPSGFEPLLRQEKTMAKEDILSFEGQVQEVLPDARYRVELDNGHLLVAYTAGRMKKNRIKTLVGDRVTVEVTPYDLEKGRLVFRHKGDTQSFKPAAGGFRPGTRRR
jgi:translation initiation factor IF-1